MKSFPELSYKGKHQHPFGMMMPARTFSGGPGSYRYGFNGKEDDKSITEEAQDYGERILEKRLGRFLSVDPITKKYPELTPYQFASNSPVRSIDLDGMEGWELSTPAANLKRDAEAKQAMLNKPQARDIEIMVWNPYRNQAQIGKTSVVMENIAIARNNYYDAIGDNIRGGPIGAGAYMFGGERASFYGAAMDGVVMSFGGISGETTVGVPNYKPLALRNSSIETTTSIAPFEQSPIKLTINLKSNWNKSQINEVYEKANIITNSPTAMVNRKNTENRPTNLRQKYIAAGGKIQKGQDVDHKQDLILNGNPGADGQTNLGGTNSSVNRSFGKQFEIQTRNVPDNTRVSGVYINPFPVKKD